MRLSYSPIKTFRKTFFNPKLRRIVVITVLIWAIIKSLAASRGQIINETEWIRRFPFASREEKLRERTSPEFYDFITFVCKNTAGDAVIMFPPQGNPWPHSGNIEYIQYFLYPRRLIRDDRQRILTDKSITHIFINWGELGVADKRIHGYPKYYVPVKKIITMFGKKASYPASAPYLEKYGLIELERGEDEQESLVGLEKDTAQYYFHKAEFLRAKGRFNEAIKELQLAKRIKPNYAWIDYLLGDTWEQLGRRDLAVFYYQKAINLSPETGWFYYALGQAYEKQGEGNEAVEVYKKSLEISPVNIWSSFALGRIYEQKKDLVQAYLFYEQTNFLGWGPTTLDSKMGLEALERLKEDFSDFWEGFKKIDSFEGRTSGIPSGDFQFIDGVVGQAVVLASIRDHVAYPLDPDFSGEGTIEFFWKPPAEIGKLPEEKIVTLLHQLAGYWLGHDGTFYLWAGRDYLGFGMFDAEQKKWHLLASKKVQWNPKKWYLLSLSFGKKGMKLFIDGNFQNGNDFPKKAANSAIFLGEGGEIWLLDFLEAISVGHGSFDELVYHQHQKEGE